MRFTAEVLATGRSGHAVEVPRELAAGLSGRRSAVPTRVEGVEYRARVGAYGGKVYLWLRQDLLRTIGRRAGETVEVTLVEDVEPEPEPPEVTEPPELTAALAADEPARTAYAALPPEHRREYWTWIGGAEEAEVRSERVARLLSRLRA